MSGDPRSSDQGSARSMSAIAATSMYVVFVILLCVFIGLLVLYGPNFWDNWAVLRYWRWVVALVPVVLVIQQALFIVYIKGPSIRADLTGGRSSERQLSSGGTQTHQQSFKTRADLAGVRSKALLEFDSYSGTLQVFVHYILAAALLGVVGIMLIYVCCEPPDCLQGKTLSVDAGKGTVPNNKTGKSVSERQGSAGPSIAIGQREITPAARRSQSLAPASDESQQRVPHWTKYGKSDEDRRILPSARSIPSTDDDDKRHVTVSANPPADENAHESIADPPPSLPAIQNSPRVNALRVGAAGALIYVLTYLGRRNFQRDITSAAALWCSVQLVLGPALAYTVAYFLVPAKVDAGSAIIDFSAIYFLAGLSPRLIADWVTS